MSACISRHGEFSNHEFSAEGADPFTCQRCWVFAESAALDALMAAEARADRLQATLDALAEKAPEERLLEAIFGTSGCRCGCGAPRWDEDRIVLDNGWNTPDRCGRCGEVQP